MIEEKGLINKISLTVDCPYCGKEYSFQEKELMNKWIDEGMKDTLHKACKREAKKFDFSTIFC